MSYVRRLLALVIVAYSLSLAATAFSEDVVLSADQLVTKSFSGFGEEWDIHSYAANNITDEDFKIVTDRLSAMKTPIVRVMFVGNYCYLGNANYDWTSRQMQFLYKQLDLCQRTGIKVLFCSWGAAADGWLKIAGISGVDDPEYANMVGTVINYLVNVKGYSCIKYVSIGNEPDLELQNDWGKWKTSAVSVAKALAAKGLGNKVTFVGPETSQVRSDYWLANSASEVSGMLGAYAMHYYAPQDLVRNGGLEQVFSSSRRLLSQDYGKPFIVSEAGMKDGSSGPGFNSHTSEFGYGVFMADYAVQAARAGAASVLAWMLDDDSHTNFNWGMWTDKANGMVLRPWFTAWSLLSQYFPPKSSLYAISQPSAVRILAARVPSKTDLHVVDYSFCLVNRDPSPREISIRIANAKSEIRSFKQLTYVDNSASNYVNTVSRSLKLNSPLTVICPPGSVTVLTTM